MNIDKTQLLTVVKVIEKLQSKLKDNTANIDELNKDMSNLSMELKDIEQELSNNISDTNNKLKQELQTLLNDLQGQFKNDREAKDIKLINYNQDNKLGLQELKTTLQDLSNKLQDYASKDIVRELSDKTDENTKDIIKTNKELDKTNKKIDKVSDKVDKIPKVDLSDYAKKKDIPKEIVKTETIKEKVLPIEIGNVNTVDPGVEANAKLTPKKDKYILDLDIPRGVTGASGRRGVTDHTELTNLNGDSDYQHITTAEKAQFGKIIYRGTVETASATAAKEVTIAGYTPTIGDILCLRYTLGTSAASPTLSINGGAAAAIKLGSTAASAVTHTVGANGEIKYCYDGAEWQMFGSMRTSDADTMQYIYWASTSIAGTAFGDYKLLMQTTDGKWHPLTLEEGTGTTKTISTQDFVVGCPILFYATTKNVAQNASFSFAYQQIQMANTLRYTDNRATRTAYKNIYLKGTVTNGLFRLDNTTYTSFITQTLPTTDDGFVYIKLGYMYSTANMLLTVDHPIYQYKDGAIRQYSPDYLPIVDTYADLEDLDSGITKAIVRQDTLVDRKYTTLDGSTQYEVLYVNPLPPLYGETYEDTYLLSTEADGTGTIQGQVEASEDDGFRLWTLQLSGINLGAVALGIQQNYIGGEFEISFNGKTNIRLSGGWIDNLAYVDTAADEVLDITMYDKKPDTVSAFLTCYITPASDDDANWHRIKYALQPTPFEINYSGIYEKIDGTWTLAMKNDKLVNGNIGVPLPT